MSDSENILITKLDEFIRRYYKNQLVKGALYSLGIVIATFLGAVFIEYLGELNVFLRTILFYTFVFSSLFVLVRFIGIPLLKLYRIGDVISYPFAAQIIGNHFSDVKDKLLNVLQLQQGQGFSVSQELLLAGINQKINELRPIPFSAAINLNENKKYLKYVMTPVIITLLVAFVSPQIISKSTSHLIHHQTYFEKEMPFQFLILNQKLETVQTKDFDCSLATYRIENNKLYFDKVEREWRDDGEGLYRLCGESHHHHLVCRNCGTTVEIEGSSVERWAEAMAKEFHFREVGHTVELFGLCAQC